MADVPAEITDSVALVAHYAKEIETSLSEGEVMTASTTAISLESESRRLKINLEILLKKNRKKNL